MKPTESRLVLAVALLAGMAAFLGPGSSAMAVATVPVDQAKETALQIRVRFGPELGKSPLDGRVLVMLSRDPAEEPRLQINDSPKTQQIFGIDVEGLGPGQDAVIGATTLGYPVASLAQVPAGNYWVQAVLHKYETFHRADGHTVKLPMDRGEGQQWNKAPGNLSSTPKEIAVDPRESAPLTITLDKVIPPIPAPATTKYIKHERIQSERLTRFWGRPMHLGAHVLLPEGFESHPDARYPLVIYHGHFPQTFSGFREEPPESNLKPEYSERFQLPAYNRVQQDYAY